MLEIMFGIIFCLAIYSSFGKRYATYAGVILCIHADLQDTNPSLAWFLTVVLIALCFDD
jgi:succinate-acetate transporter protein